MECPRLIASPGLFYLFIYRKRELMWLHSAIITEFIKALSGSITDYFIDVTRYETLNISK